MTIIQRTVLRWYQKNKRDLPWRKTRNPYKILVSEIMLQQTQVDRVLPKYKEFLKKFPTAQMLAQAKTADVIKAWKGLGYNRRALFLQKAAQAVILEYGGEFPKDITELKKLPGIGDYTARAILAFAYGDPVAVLDTNHRRFYQRVLFGLRKKSDKELLKFAQNIFSPSFDSAQDDTWYRWNQALMDFGSLICLTRRPKCEICPVRKYCKAYPHILNRREKRVGRKKTVPFRETDRYFRGRIMDLLRERPRVSRRDMRQQFAELPAVRFEKILMNLEKDGLIVIRQRSILLP